MSKKDRLKAQSLKQLEQKKAALHEEEAERKNHSESKSAAKMRRQAKKFDSVITLILKILMLLPFGYSAFYYGGIFTVGIATGEMEGIPKRIAVFFAIGAALCLAGLFFVFFSKYVVQFVLVAMGTASYMYSARYVISATQKKLSEVYVTDESLKVLDKTYMTYFYPILIMLLLSLVLLIMFIIRKLKKKRSKKRERDNAPVKSIVED